MIITFNLNKSSKTDQAINFKLVAYQENSTFINSLQSANRCTNGQTNWQGK